MGKNRRGYIPYVVLGVILALACKKPAQQPVPREEGVVEPCSNSGEFFPSGQAGLHGPSLFFGDFQVQWESNFLKRMHEPSLYACARPSDDAEYRFLWDRSLGQPVAARLTVHKDGSGVLTIRALANSGIPSPPSRGKKNTVFLDEWYRVVLDRKIDVSTDQVSHALELFHRVRFVDDNPGRRDTTDGSDWIMEAREGAKYRLVDFRNGYSNPARNYGLYLIQDLGKVEILGDKIYR
ncbi:MAG: hypothetical protein WBX19_15140 [Terracidiphilus sp.]